MQYIYGKRKYREKLPGRSLLLSWIIEGRNLGADYMFFGPNMQNEYSAGKVRTRQLAEEPIKKLHFQPVAYCGVSCTFWLRRSTHSGTRLATR